MKKSLLLSVVLFSMLCFSQKKKSALSNWKNKDAEIAKKIFSKYGQKEKKDFAESKKKLAQSQKKLKIEIINNGDWEKYNEICWFRFVKVNDGDLKQIVNTDSTNIEVETNTMGTENWKDGNGGFNFTSISDLMTISQEFVSKRNEKGKLLNPLKATEIFETMTPVLSFLSKIYTHKKEHSIVNAANLSKTVNIYSDGQLVKTYTILMKT